MATEAQPRTRRAVLAAAAGAAAGLVASSATPQHARGADTRYVELGGRNETDATTLIVKEGDTAGLRVDSPVATAIVGTSTSFPGVLGWSAAAPGVRGLAGQIGVEGVATHGTGVLGLVGIESGTGVWGRVQSDSDTGAHENHGVRGSTNTRSGMGVLGEALSPNGGTGIRGDSGAGNGVVGQTATGAGVRARSSSGTGRALVVEGRAAFSTARRVTISTGRSSVKVTNSAVSSSSMVLATLQQRRTGIYVAAVVPAAGSFTIYLNKAVSTSTLVAYFVIG